MKETLIGIGVSVIAIWVLLLVYGIGKSLLQMLGNRED
jgi:hypothetical protein